MIDRGRMLHESCKTAGGHRYPAYFDACAACGMDGKAIRALEQDDERIAAEEPPTEPSPQVSASSDSARGSNPRSSGFDSRRGGQS